MQHQPKIIISLTVDWEGEHFKNVHDLQWLLQKFASHIPVTHFICPSYFTSKIKNAEKSITSVLKNTDEVGLHIHGFRSLVEHCSVTFRTEHNYYKRHLNQLANTFPQPLKNWLQRNFISGRGVPVGVYNDDEIYRILNGALHLLKDHLQRTTIYGFRAGGWLMRDGVYDVLENMQFQYDSSAVPPEILSHGFTKANIGSKKDDYGHFNGYFTELVTRAWGGNLQKENFITNKKLIDAAKGKPISKLTQPFRIGTIMEMPNNGGLSDFASLEKTLIPLFHKFLENLEKYKTTQFLNFGCHQEGSAQYKLAIAEFLKYIEAYQDKVDFLTVHEASKLVS